MSVLERLAGQPGRSNLGVRVLSALLAVGALTAVGVAGALMATAGPRERLGALALVTLAVATVAVVLLRWVVRPMSDLATIARCAADGRPTPRSAASADTAQMPNESESTTERFSLGALPGSGDIEVIASAFADMLAEVELGRRAIAEQGRAIEEKESARGQLLEKLIDAQEEERKRIARELHDGVGQTLLSLGVGLKLLQSTMDVEAARTKAEELRRIVGETLEQVRMISRELRPSVLDDLGLAVALDRYAAEFERRHPGLEVDVHSDNAGRLPSLVETALYRIVQEAMTNAARHSGCTTLSVLLSRRDHAVQAIIEDDGAGFDVSAVRAARASVGLHGMSERAELVGGRLDIESSSDGTAVFVEVPL